MHDDHKKRKDKPTTIERDLQSNAKEASEEQKDDLVKSFCGYEIDCSSRWLMQQGLPWPNDYKYRGA